MRPRSARWPRSAGWVAPLAATALVAGLSGCASLASPAVITTPYQAADGTNFRLPDSSVHLANFVVVGIKKGEPASVVGSVVNDGTTPVELALSTAGSAAGAQTTVTVPAGGSTQIGPDKDTSMTLAELPVDPGANLSMNAATSASGTASFIVPVVRTTGYYESLTPSPTPSPTPSASRTRRAGSGTGSSSSSATSTPTTSPTS